MMIKSVKYAGIAVIMAAVLAGCVRTSTLNWYPPAPDQKSSSGNPVVYNLEAYNCGLYLFYFIPVWSGRPAYPNRKDYKSFAHFVNEEDTRRMMDIHLKKWGAEKVEDLSFSTDNSWLWGLGILWRRSISAKGVAVKNPIIIKK